ncbi:hypothetical protein Fcan01_17381 [Folsomia candida]|uniref:Uncharacterized protein n=2 Tax=Folsomia candida TaxID=158441 RepID=A0A226DSB4_FOLCA|nr:hypothetical protein Fcan01_17381 [Folsomia candida]
MVEHDDSIGSIESCLEKVSAVRLLLVFCVTVKNLLQHKETSESELEQLLRDKNCWNIKHTILLANQNLDMKTNGLYWSRPTSKELANKPNIPLELTYHLTLYVKSILKRGLIDSVIHGGMNNNIVALVESLTGLERILRTPIPIAYSIHLVQTLWIYLFALPYQMIGSIGWFAVPAVGIASFALLGILAIGAEVEDPFGSDTEWGTENDLPLNQFCEEIKAEIENLLTNPFLSFDCSEDKIVETKDCDDESIHENVNGENTMSQRRRSYPRGNESVIEIIGGNRYDGNYGDGDGTGGLLQSWC